VGEVVLQGRSDVEKEGASDVSKTQGNLVKEVAGNPFCTRCRSYGHLARDCNRGR
jgi:hypothetical protein